MNLIKKFRKDLDLSQTEFGELFGVGANAIHFYETYQRVPGWKVAIWIVYHAADCDLEYLTLDTLYGDYYAHWLKNK